jgi:hypothetical protein
MSADPGTGCLLLFYAAECGLKERFLTRRKLRDTESLDFRNDLHGHEIRELAKELGLPAGLLDKLQGCRRKDKKRPPVALKDVHEAWRYGAKLNPSDEQKAAEAFTAVIQWCQKD